MVTVCWSYELRARAQMPVYVDAQVLECYYVLKVYD